MRPGIRRDTLILADCLLCTAYPDSALVVAQTARATESSRRVGLLYRMVLGATGCVAWRASPSAARWYRRVAGGPAAPAASRGDASRSWHRSIHTVLKSAYGQWDRDIRSNSSNGSTAAPDRSGGSTCPR